MAEKQLTEDERMKMLFAEEGLIEGSRRTKVVNIDCSDLGYDEYIGKFKFHYPSIVERVKIGTDQANFLNRLPRESIDVYTNNSAYIMATLMNVVDYCPDWFKLNVIGDYRVLEKVFNVYSKWVDSFRKSSKRVDDEGNSEKSKAQEVHLDHEKVDGPSD